MVRVSAVIAVSAFATLAFGSTAPGGRAARIREFANRWMGTAYVWGGDSRGGIDCSAYLRQMYRDLFRVELPRTTRQQIELGVDLPVTAMNPERSWEPGDLIFYIDRAGVPNHVVVYMGSGQLTHSVSGRGVVVDGMKQLWGRRIVARRLLIPTGRSESFGPIPAAGPIVPQEVPCPPQVAAKANEIRRYSKTAIGDVVREVGVREICEYRALAEAVRNSGEIGRKNAARLVMQAEWMESIEALKGEMR